MRDRKVEGEIYRERVVEIREREGYRERCKGYRERECERESHRALPYRVCALVQNIRKISQTEI